MSARVVEFGEFLSKYGEKITKLLDEGMMYSRDNLDVMSLLRIISTW